jgi:DNA-binding CsgD family transcriptional regulator
MDMQRHPFHGLLSLNGELLYCNANALQLVDAKLEDVVGTPVWDAPWLSEPGQSAVLKRVVTRAAQGDGPQWGELILAANGKTMMVDVTVHPVINGEGRMVSLIAGASPKGASLTDREKEVLAWTSKGKTAWEVGGILGISKRTTEFHANSAKAKLKASNIIHAVAVASKYGIISMMGTGICGVGMAAALESPTIRKLLRDLREHIFLLV